MTQLDLMEQTDLKHAIYATVNRAVSDKLKRSMQNFTHQQIIDKHSIWITMRGLLARLPKMENPDAFSDGVHPAVQHYQADRHK